MKFVNSACLAVDNDILLHARNHRRNDQYCTSILGIPVTAEAPGRLRAPFEPSSEWHPP